jgi:hypothetical protein
VCARKIRSVGIALATFIVLTVGSLGPINAQESQPSIPACKQYEQQIFDQLLAISATRQKIAAEQKIIADAAAAKQAEHDAAFRRLEGLSPGPRLYMDESFEEKRREELYSHAATAPANLANLETQLIQQTGQYELSKGLLENCRISARTRGAGQPDVAKPTKRKTVKRKTDKTTESDASPSEPALDPDTVGTITGIVIRGFSHRSRSHGSSRPGPHTTGSGSATTGAGSGGGCTTGTCISDIRVKRDIFQLVRLDNGIGLYSYRYNWSDQLFVGVLAQEVENIIPAAVKRAPNGYLIVNYRILGLREMTWEKWIASTSASNRATRWLRY